jgi:ectoine hydroxylase-related dioxygenase (phytanoyl-CoA dioxygenase family)
MKLTNKQVERFELDGVIHVPGAVDKDWIDELLEMSEKAMSTHGEWINDGNPGAQANRMFTRRYMWKDNSVIAHFLKEGPCGAIAGQAMGSSSARFYFDHLLIKEPMTEAPTPWHQDIPYWPFMGSQVCSVWVALTDATVEESAMEFVRGSHRDGKYYKPELFNDRRSHPNSWALEAKGEPVPDIEADREAFEIIGFDVAAGDAIVFSAWILHGAPGNASENRRRVALSTRWLGNNAVWQPKPGADPIVGENDVSVLAGDYPSDDDNFPVFWSS